MVLLMLALLAAWRQNRELERAERIANGRLASALAEEPGRGTEALVLGLNNFAGARPADVPAAAVEGMAHGLMQVRELTTLQGHADSVVAVSFSPDGTRVVTASDDDSARLWDAREGGVLAALQGHNNSVTAASFSPDGTRLVTARMVNRSLRFRDIRPKSSPCRSHRMGRVW
jgi:WD40 repeat protein